MSRHALLILVVAALSAGAQPRREVTRQAVENIPLQGKAGLAQLARVAIVDGHLVADLASDVPVQNEPLRYRANDGDGDAAWVVRKRSLGANNDMIYTTVTRYDFAAPPDALWSTAVSTRPGLTSIFAQTGDAQNGLRVRLTQSVGSISVSCHSAAPGAQTLVFQATAPSLAQLQAENPAEVREYLAPVLLNLTGRYLMRPAAVDVYRAFESIPVDPAVDRRLDAILVRLEAASPTEREAAQKELVELGAPGVLAAVRRPVDDFAPEVRNRVAAFVARHANLPAADIPRARTDGHFLIDCLDDDDTAVRTAARQALEKLLGETIEFDMRSGGKYRTLAVEALRKKYEKQLRPAPATRRSRTGVEQ